MKENLKNIFLKEFIPNEITVTEVPEFSKIEYTVLSFVDYVYVVAQRYYDAELQRCGKDTAAVSVVQVVYVRQTGYFTYGDCVYPIRIEVLESAPPEIKKLFDDLYVLTQETGQIPYVLFSTGKYEESY